MADCDDIRERVKLERSVYLHGMLPVDLLGGPEEMRRRVPAKVMGRNVEAVDLTQGFGMGTPLWPYNEDMGTERVRYHARNRVLSQALNNHIMHAATHTDAPGHVEEEYPLIDEIPLEHYFGKGVIVSIPKKKWGVISPEDLEKAEPSIEQGDIVIIHTGWHRFWGDSVKYYVYAPGLYKEAGEWFVKKRVKGVGYDTQAADHPLGTRIAQPPALLPWVLEEYKKETGREVSEDFPYWEPCHRLLLTHGIANFENVGGDIDRVLGKRCTIFAVPVKWLRGDGSPVRIFALLERR